ncbi:E3 ubiquitin-protein ligase RNF167-like [Hemicordylus capensis]|uniref:E3 ubiquitin-protein ligase RNF167-like n=1 Tax=Hemicordylus capensis TaxID=884348 RepID=UPI00230232B3|nr:E3 ubiquitin-protein ligase RNF167-like [Hemicordylus capensis]
MGSNSPAPFHVITIMLVLQVPTGKSFIRAVCSHNSTCLDFRALPALFGPPLPTEGLKGLLIEAKPANACHPIESPPNSSSIFVALIRRYDCSFATKVLHAQQAGYHAAIVHNTNSQTLVSMVSEADAKQEIHIPSVFTTDMISKVLKWLHRSGKLTSVILIPEYFHFTWQGASRTTRISSSDPCLCHIQLPGPCSQMVYLHAFWIVCMLSIGVVACSFMERYFLRCLKWWKGKSQPPQENRKEFPSFSFTSSTYQECAICLEKYVECDSLKVLSCSHAFHSKCVDLWHITQARSKTCPLCKQKVMVVTRLQATRLWKEGMRENSQTVWSSKSKPNEDQRRCPLLSQRFPSQF